MTTDSSTRVLVVVEQLRRRAPGGIGTYARGLLQGLAELAASPPDDTGTSGGGEVQAVPDGGTGGTGRDGRAGGTGGTGGAAGRLPAIELSASRWDKGAAAGPGSDPPARDPLAALGFPLRSSWLPDPLLTRAWRTGILKAPPGFDVVHAASLAMPRPGAAGLVATVHDLLWRRVPEAYPKRGRDWHEAALQRALRTARRFVVPADVVARDLVGAGAAEGSVSVVPMGCDHLPPPDLGGRDALLGRLGVDGPYLLSVGTVEPRKNLDRLVAAYGRIRASLPEPWPLVIVGPAGWGDGPQVATGVVQTGAVTPGILSALYDGARLLAYVPLVEGFGLPPVEAMAAGIPVVASDLPSTQGAALDVDPYDVASIADGLLAAATDDGPRARLIEAGRARAAELKWAGIAERHVAIWEAVAHGAEVPQR